VILESQDATKSGSYPISYRTYYTDYPSRFLDNVNAFTVTITDLCDNPVSVTASDLTDQSYTITQNKFSYQVPSFVADPAWCKITYSYTVSHPKADKALSFND